MSSIRGQSGRSFCRVAVVGGPARLVLRPWGSFIWTKQHIPQLLGAVGVEVRVLHLAADIGELRLDLFVQVRPEPFDAGFVHQDAGAGHVGQHLRQGKLDLVVEEILPQAVISAFILANRPARQGASGQSSQAKAGLILYASARAAMLYLAAEASSR